MELRSVRRCRELGDSGVALPIALFGLVAVSLLVTSALITSSTEVALSRAQQDGTRALYAADAALEEFLAERAAMTTNLDQRLASASYAISTSGGSFAVAVAELFRGAPVALGDGSYERRETYSLVSQPGDGRGRSVGALIDVTRAALPVSLNIDSGLTLGTNTTISGSATISNGSSAGAACDSAAAPAAIRHSSNTDVVQQGNGSDIVGAIIQDTRNSAGLMEHVLNGKSIDQLSALATIRFGPMFGKPAFAGSPSQTATDPNYRWGCPPQMVTGCSSSQAAYFPAVAIDADGGEADITNFHGQGVLVVRNGNARIRGTFKYAGIIVVEGTLRVTGTPRIEGAVVVMGDETVIEPEEDSEFSAGNSLIRFNKCQIVEAQKGLTVQSLNSAPQTIATPTYAWFEVLR